MARKKFTFVQVLVIIWVMVSFWGILVVAEGGFRLLFAFIASLAASTCVANRMDWTGTAMDPDEE